MGDMTDPTHQAQVDMHTITIVAYVYIYMYILLLRYVYIWISCCSYMCDMTHSTNQTQVVTNKTQVVKRTIIIVAYAPMYIYNPIYIYNIYIYILRTSCCTHMCDMTGVCVIELIPRTRNRFWCAQSQSLRMYICICIMLLPYVWHDSFRTQSTAPVWMRTITIVA